MEVICIQGGAPGSIIATVSHRGDIRQLKMEARRHKDGGWQISQNGGCWGPRCHAVATAVLLEASEAFVDESMALAAD